MELRARILLVISISSLILYLSVEGLSILPSITQPVSKLDEDNQLEKHQGSRVLDEPKEASRHAVSPTPETRKSSSSASSPGLGQEKKAPNPTTLWGGISGVLQEAEKTIAPVTSSIVNEAEAVSSSIFGLGTHAPSPTPTPFSGPVPYPNSPSSSSHPDTSPPSEHAPLSNSPSSTPGMDLGPTPSPFSGPIPYPNPPSPSLDSNPLPGSSPFPGPVPYPNPPSPSLDSNPLPGSSPFPGPVPYPNSPSPSLDSNPLPGSSPFSGPVPSFSPGSVPVPGPSPAPGFFDHDVALAIEARIKRSQTDAQLAMDEAKKLLNDPNVASSETGKCLSKCVDKYSASLNELNRAITDLGVRDVTLLADDFGAVETDISACQACFTENMGEDSPLKGLEEATAKAARECLTVMDYAA